MKRLEETIPPTNSFNRLFLDLLRRIFVYDPKQRITAREALKHPWFNELVEDDGTEATRIRLEKERMASASSSSSSSSAAAAAAAATAANQHPQPPQQHQRGGRTAGR